jgi:hypothetical protein
MLRRTKNIETPPTTVNDFSCALHKKLPAVCDFGDLSENTVA